MTFDLGTQHPACLLPEPILEDSVPNFVEGWNSALYPLVKPDEVCAESRFDRTQPTKCGFVFDLRCKGGAEASDDAIRRGGMKSVAGQKGIRELDRSLGLDGSLGEFEQ